MVATILPSVLGVPGMTVDPAAPVKLNDFQKNLVNGGNAAAIWPPYLAAPVVSRVVGLRSLSGPSVIRASKGGSFLADGSILMVGNNEARWSPAGRLYVEDASTQSIRNPLMEGANVPPGTNPTYATLSVSGGSVTMQPISTGTDARGFTYVDLLMAGTATISGVLIPTFESTAGIAALTGQVWGGSMFWKQISGPNTLTCRLEPRPSDASNVVLSGFTSAQYTAGTEFERMEANGTLSAANIAYVRLNWRVNYTLGVTYNDVIRITIPNMSLGGVRSPLVPDVGVLAAQTRAFDRVSAAVAGDAIRGVAGTFSVWNASSPTQGFWQLDDGTNNNRIVAYLPGSTTARLRHFIGNTATIDAALGVVPIGAPFSLAVNWTPDGAFKAKIAGGSEVTVNAPALVTGLTSLRVGGASAGGGGILVGEVGPLDTYTALTPLDAMLGAL